MWDWLRARELQRTKAKQERKPPHCQVARQRETSSPQPTSQEAALSPCEHLRGQRTFPFTL